MSTVLPVTDRSVTPFEKARTTLGTDTSVIIVSWNACAYLRKCLDSLRLSNPPCVREIIVVDNDSNDGSPEMVEAAFPNVHVIRSGANLGFAGANNLAMKVAKGNFFALVNSDALVHRGCLETLREYLMKHPDVGLVGPRVNGGDGYLQRTSRHLPTLWNTLCRALAVDKVFATQNIFSGYEVPPALHDIPHDAAVLSGCFWVARRDAIDQVGMLDETFFFYGEDIDWCRRFVAGGWKVRFVPEATATHFGGGSSGTHLRFSVEMLRATLKYWTKHHGMSGRYLCQVLLVLHHSLRLACRAAARLFGGGVSPHSRQKFAEDLACLRWLLFGIEPASVSVPSQSQDSSRPPQPE